MFTAGRPDGWEPAFLDRPVMRKLPITTWHAYQLLGRFNAGQSWDEQIKPGDSSCPPSLLPALTALGPRE